MVMEGGWATRATHAENNNFNLVMHTGDLFVHVVEGLLVAPGVEH